MIVRLHYNAIGSHHIYLHLFSLLKCILNDTETYNVLYKELYKPYIKR